MRVEPTTSSLLAFVRTLPPKKVFVFLLSSICSSHRVRMRLLCLAAGVLWIQVVAAFSADDCYNTVSDLCGEG